MRILALDLATKTGYAHTDGTSGVWRLPNGPNGRRWMDFKEWLDDMVGMHGTDVIVAEASLHQPGTAGRMANAMHTMIEVVCDKYQLDYKRVAASTLKKYATGSGRGDKAAMWQAAKARGIASVPVDDNHLDALWVLDWALHEL